MLKIIGCNHVEGRTICGACLYFNACEAVREHPERKGPALALRMMQHHVTGAIARGEAQPVIEQRV